MALLTSEKLCLCLTPVYRRCTQASRYTSHKPGLFDDSANLKNNVSRFPTSNVKDLPLNSQELMYTTDDKVGFIPNLYHALAHRPKQFQSFIQFRNSIMKRDKSKLTNEDFEMIGLAVSAHNRCIYCVIAHSALHRATSRRHKLTEQIAINPESADLDGRQRAIISLAMSVSKCEVITDKHFNHLSSHGLDSDDAWDIASMAAFTSMANRMISFLKVTPNEEYYSLGR